MIHHNVEWMPMRLASMRECMHALLFSLVQHHTTGTSAAPRRAAPRGAAQRLSAPCRAGPRHAETQEQCAQTVPKTGNSGGARLGPALISGGPNRGSSQTSQNYTCIKTQ